MDRRTKILASLFGVIVAYVILSEFAYPRWIAPLLMLDDQIAKRSEVLEKLQAERRAVEAAKEDYIELMGRVGSRDVIRVETDIRGRLNQLIEKHGLQPANVSGGRTSRDSKTGVESSFLDVSAEAPFSSVIQFLRDVNELPHLLRITSLKISPASSSRRGREREAERVSLNMPLEIRILPEQRKLLGKLEDSKLTRPETMVRHRGRDYSAIWERKPFTEYEKLIPLVVAARQPNVMVDTGQPVTLQVNVTGGNGQHSYLWSPSTGLNNPSVLNPTVDSSSPGSHTYTVTVTDQRGQTAQATVNVTIKEKVVRAPEPTRAPPPPPPPPPPPRGRQRWPNGRELQLTMFLSREEGSKWVDELMLYDQRARSSSFFKVGDPFDGGELVHIATRGGVVRWEDQYWVYPLGSGVDVTLPAEDVRDTYPELYSAAKRHQLANPPIAPPVNTEKAGFNSQGQALPTGLAESVGTGPITGELGELVGPPTLAGQDASNPAQETAGNVRSALEGAPAAKPSDDSGGTRAGEQSGTVNPRPRRPARTGGPRGNQIPQGAPNPPADQPQKPDSSGSP